MLPAAVVDKRFSEGYLALGAAEARGRCFVLMVEGKMGQHTEGNPQIVIISGSGRAGNDVQIHRYDISSIIGRKRTPSELARDGPLSLAPDRKVQPRPVLKAKFPAILATLPASPSNMRRSRHDRKSLGIGQN